MMSTRKRHEKAILSFISGHFHTKSNGDCNSRQFVLPPAAVIIIYCDVFVQSFCPFVNTFVLLHILMHGCFASVEYNGTYVFTNNKQFSSVSSLNSQYEAAFCSTNSTAIVMKIDHCDLCSTMKFLLFMNLRDGTHYREHMRLRTQLYIWRREVNIKRLRTCAIDLTFSDKGMIVVQKSFLKHELLKNGHLFLLRSSNLGENDVSTTTNENNANNQ